MKTISIQNQIFTKDEFAKLLDGREYGEEMSMEEAAMAKHSNLVVMFGASDDLVEFRGAAYDEKGGYNKTRLYVTSDGRVLGNHEEEDCNCEFCGFDDAKKSAIEIVCDFTKNGWVFTTSVPSAQFSIKETVPGGGNDHYGFGIVFDLFKAKGQA